MTQSQFEIDLKNFEGYAEHFYLDSVGEVTIGIGLMFKRPQSVFSSHIRFVRKADKKDASNDEIESDFKAVKESAKNNPLSFYDRITNLTANPLDIDAEFRKRLSNAINEAQKFYENDIDNDLNIKYRTFDELPSDVQFAIVDMSFNLGYSKLKKYKKFRQHLRRGEWSQAAEASHRRGIQFRRNKKVYDLIYQFFLLENNNTVWMTA